MVKLLAPCCIPFEGACVIQIMGFHGCGCGSTAPLCSPEIQSKDIPHKAGEFSMWLERLGELGDIAFLFPTPGSMIVKVLVFMKFDK